MGHNIARPIKLTRIFCAELAASLEGFKTAATKALNAAETSADREIAARRLAQVQAVTTRAEDLFVLAGGPHRDVSGTAFAVLLHAADDVHDDVDGTYMYPGRNCTWTTKTFITNTVAGAAAGGADKAGAGGLKRLRDAGYLTVIATHNQAGKYEVADLVTAWWETFLADPFWAEYLALGKQSVYIPNWVRSAPGTSTSRPSPVAPSTPVQSPDEGERPNVLTMPAPLTPDEKAAVIARKKGMVA